MYDLSKTRVLSYFQLGMTTYGGDRFVWKRHFSRCLREVTTTSCLYRVVVGVDSRAADDLVGLNRGEEGGTRGRGRGRENASPAHAHTHTHTVSLSG